MPENLDSDSDNEEVKQDEPMEYTPGPSAKNNNNKLIQKSNITIECPSHF